MDTPMTVFEEDIVVGVRATLPPWASDRKAGRGSSPERYGLPRKSGSRSQNVEVHLGVVD